MNTPPVVLCPSAGTGSSTPTSAPAYDIEVPGPGRPVRGSAPDWSPFGVLVPVLAGSSGAGASALAAGLADVMAASGSCALLVDPAQPSRSGLSSAAQLEGSTTHTTPDGVRVRWSWREQALLAQLDADPEPLSPALIVEPRSWLPPSLPLNVTVVDLGTDWSRPPPGRDPLAGAASWLRTVPGDAGARPYPLMVVRATRPSLLAAEAALARFDPLLRAGELAGAAQLVVMASWKSRWPPGVAGAAGARLAPLLDDAVFVPFDQDLERGGVTEAATPARVAAVLARFLAQWGPVASAVPLQARPTGRTRSR